ncbi:MAG: VWA domain-containing protein, partial [Flavobacteriales bacterium]|nr:VWA domain-containing protein [Flavobacteriales bacterium]
MRPDRDRLHALLWVLLAAVATGAAAWWMHRAHVPAAPRAFWVLLPLLAAVAWYIVRLHRRRVQVVLPTLPVLTGRRGFLVRWRYLPFALTVAGCGLLVLALARPQSREHWRDVEREGIDIMIALDVSGSMLARDLRPDRLEASKRVAMEFIDARPDDRIGLVIYEGGSFSQCPLTTDHRVLKELFMGVRSGLLDGGTAIGMGLATALNRLRESAAKSKVTILLTDGVNTAGLVQPMDAAQIAQALGVRVYTIGVG